MTASDRDQSAVETLVLDIDGVLVIEASAGSPSGAEVLLLHENLDARLGAIGAEVFFLTHRSRPEAAAILDAAGLSGRWLGRCLCANDIFKSALTSKQWLRLLRHGMQKSLALPELRRRYGVRPERSLFVDDRIDNVLDMCGRGIGLGAVAPSSVDAAGMVTTFDFDEVSEIVSTHRWPDGAHAAAVRHLRPHAIRIDHQRRTGLGTLRSSRNVFNLARRSAAMIRKGFRRRSDG
jgi:hypothetical protein